MTGRLDRVDLASDLVLVVLSGAGDPVPLGELADWLADVDADPFVFDPDPGLEDLVDDVAMFSELGFVDVADRDDVELALTGRGERMASILVDELETDQYEALPRRVRP